jgi:hypothetical protein
MCWGAPRNIEMNLDPRHHQGRVAVAVVRQALRFDPMPEATARQIFDELRARLPVLAFKRGAAISVPETKLRVAEIIHQGQHDFRFPTLIPSDLTPQPYGAGATSIGFEDAASTLATLVTCLPVRDERLVTAVDLFVATKYETLPRSVFLTYLTILDSLAERLDRPSAVTMWIEEKLQEAKRFNDQSLESALGNLKETSHSSAIRELVGRAEKVLGSSPKEVQTQKSRARGLYQLRSRLSHAGGAPIPPQQIDQARLLVRRVVCAALDHPEILTNADGATTTPQHRTGCRAMIRRLLRWLSQQLARMRA